MGCGNNINGSFQKRMERLHKKVATPIDKERIERALDLQTQYKEKAIDFFRKGGGVVSICSSNNIINLVAEGIEVRYDEKTGTRLIVDGVDITHHVGSITVTIGKDYPRFHVTMAPARYSLQTAQEELDNAVE